MPITFKDRRGVLIARPLDDEIGADQADEMKQKLLDQVAGKRWVAVDMSGVRFMDSSGLGVLVAALKATRGEGEMRLFGVQAPVMELFRLTRLDKVFAMDPNENICVSTLESDMRGRKSA
jgi:anti-sigma B factor antagonist